MELAIIRAFGAFFKLIGFDMSFNDFSISLPMPSAKYLIKNLLI